MTMKTREKDFPETDTTSDVSSHPLDNWLKRELQTLYADFADEPLPPEMTELAARLEEKLRSASDREQNPGEG